MEQITGIIGAMDKELTALAAAMDGVERREFCGSEVLLGHCMGRRVAVTKSGIGKVNAAFVAQALVREFGAGRVYMTGVAGGIAGKLKTLDAFVPDGFVQYDVVKPGDPDGLIDILGEVVVRPSEELAAPLAAACSAARGLMATGERFVESDGDRQWILSRFPAALAADMESGAVAQVCARLGVPFACVKIISDTGDSAEYYDFVRLAADKAVRALLQVL